MARKALLQTSLPGRTCRRGKVRDIYDLGRELLIIATDRISAFDVVMPNGIPDKGRVLTQISAFWFRRLEGLTPNHLVSVALEDLPREMRLSELDGRIMLCRKAEVVPIECVVRGFLAGSAWKEYQKSGTVCGIRLPAGLRQCDRLDEPIFTPSTKAEVGHDENISFERGCEQVGRETMTELRDRSLEVYRLARDYAVGRGILLADTKFEWGRDAEGRILLIDEVLTPDSSRFWPADAYQPGRDQPSFDKQFVRDYLDRIGFNRTPPGPALPDDVVEQTRRKYVEAYARLTGRKFPWE